MLAAPTKSQLLGAEPVTLYTRGGEYRNPRYLARLGRLLATSAIGQGYGP